MKRDLRVLATAGSLLLVLAATDAAFVQKAGAASGEQTSPFSSTSEASEVSLAAAVHNAHPLRAACPFPTVRRGRRCVLEHDVTLTATLDLRSFTHLNCQGHRITPSVRGTSTENAERSQPEVAILLRHAYAVKIYNCAIEGFDFGIFALNSKVSPQDSDDPVTLADLRNTILGNTINARFTPISLMSVDNTHISDNILTYNSEGGVGLTVQRNSRLNHITYNQVIGNLTFPDAVRVPGPKSDPTGSNPILRAGDGILIAQVNGPEPALFNAVIENTLYQLIATNSMAPNEDFTADNLVEGNTITLPQGTNDDGIVLAVPQRAMVRNNTITGASHGMRAGAQTGPRRFPGACSGNTSRLCLSNDDCNIPGVDSGSQGTCTNPAPLTQPVDWFSDRSTMENNRVLTPFTDGIDLSGKNNLLQGNTITGPGNPDGAGIHLFGKHAVETTIMKGNTISNISNALFLTKIFQQLTASRFGAQISLNTFTGYTTAVRTSNSTSNTANPYDLPSELSVGQCSGAPAAACITDSDCSSVGVGTCTNSQGNYWGLICPQGFDPTKVVDTNGHLNPNVVDSHPFGNRELTDRCS
jgi:hypothetical protein